VRRHVLGGLGDLRLEFADPQLELARLGVTPRLPARKLQDLALLRPPALDLVLELFAPRCERRDLYKWEGGGGGGGEKIFEKYVR
jgi:hypothetical protein